MDIRVYVLGGKCMLNASYVWHYVNSLHFEDFSQTNFHPNQISRVLMNVHLT